MHDEYPQYLKLQAPCGSYNLVITVNLSTNTNSKMHPASSASNFKRELKNTLSFWYFCQCNLNPFTDLQEKKNVMIKKNTQLFPTTTIQLKGRGKNTTNNWPDISKSRKETHGTCWSKERTWKLQKYLPVFGFPVLSECGGWFNPSSGHHWAVSELAKLRALRGRETPAISANLKGCQGILIARKSKLDLFSFPFL